MIQLHACKCCGRTEILYYECEVCGERMDFIPILLTIDTQDYHFDKLECIVKFLRAELKKETK